MGPQRWSGGCCAEPRPRAQTTLGPSGPVRSGCMPRLHRLAGAPHRRCPQPPPEGKASLGTEWIRFFLGRLQSGIHILECTGCEHAPGQTPGSSGVTVGVVARSWGCRHSFFQGQAQLGDLQSCSPVSGCGLGWASVRCDPGVRRSLQREPGFGQHPQPSRVEARRGPRYTPFPAQAPLKTQKDCTWLGEGLRGQQTPRCRSGPALCTPGALFRTEAPLGIPQNHSVPVWGPSALFATSATEAKASTVLPTPLPEFTTPEGPWGLSLPPPRQALGPSAALGPQPHRQRCVDVCPYFPRLLPSPRPATVQPLPPLPQEAGPGLQVS